MSPLALSRCVRVLLAACAALLLAAPAASQAATPGVNIDSYSDQRVDAALATGAKLVRLFVRWDQLQPRKGASYGSAQDPGAANANNAEDPGVANVRAGYDGAIKRLNAGGAKPIFVILGTPPWANGGSADELKPPDDPQDYADFFAQFVRHSNSVGDVAAYEVWNEEDAAEFWHGDFSGGPYAAMLKATYAAAKPVAGDSAILVGPTTGNNASFVQKLYEAGLKGSFDGVAVHTDTACLSLGPDFYYREDPSARIGQFSFLGYRSVRQVMLANQDPSAKIWMTELGWSATDGGPTSCQRGTGKGVRASGVSEATQAEFLSQAYGCLARDEYVVAATWFTLNDRRDQPLDEMNHYGLLNLQGQPKPAYAAFKKLTATGGGSAGPCGDFSAPRVSFVTPDNTPYTKSVLLQATATDVADEGVKPAGLSRISFSVDGGPAFYRFNGAKDGDTVSLDWLRAADLPDGPHVVTAEATDLLGNVSVAKLTILKGAQFVKNVSYATKIQLPTKGKPVVCKGSTCTISGRLIGPAGQSLAGRVRVEWQLYVKQRVKSKIKGKKAYVSKYVTFYKGGSSAAKPFVFRQKLSRKGKWRVRVSYDGAPPLKKTVTPWKGFRV
ncbi:MAG: cellulase family glycosylhydrolase [Solirubrobacterales bacterium]|nr:cellulase family glycosylhydrolase [Solirubrobacterales bacterium]